MVLKLPRVTSGKRTNLHFPTECRVVGGTDYRAIGIGTNFRAPQVVQMIGDEPILLITNSKQCTAKPNTHRTSLET